MLHRDGLSALTAREIASLKDRLHSLYADGSKHAVYQNVPEFVRDALGYQEPIEEGWRSDTPRFHYFADRLAFPASASIADVGANTGYFSLNLAQTHPGCSIHAFEPNRRHATFIREIASAFSLRNISVRNDPWTAENLKEIGWFDVVFLLNILHHAGFDFDSTLPDRNDAFEAFAVDYLARLRRCTKLLCFQIGSNRGGDKSRPLFAFDDDVGRLEWSCRLLDDSGWTVRHIGYAARGPTGSISYSDLPEDLVAKARAKKIRNSEISDYLFRANFRQFPGEFYRRPLFICEAR